jgi:hypothetical protein
MIDQQAAQQQHPLMHTGRHGNLSTSGIRDVLQLLCTACLCGVACWQLWKGPRAQSQRQLPQRTYTGDRHANALMWGSCTARTNSIAVAPLLLQLTELALQLLLLQQLGHCTELPAWSSCVGSYTAGTHQAIVQRQRTRT